VCGALSPVEQRPSAGSERAVEDWCCSHVSILMAWPGVAWHAMLGRAGGVFFSYICKCPEPASWVLMLCVERSAFLTGCL